MSLLGLLLRFGIGYFCGLLLGPFLRGREAKRGDISVVGGVAGGLGAAIPYVFLESVWMQNRTSLIAHNVWVSIATGIIALIAAEIIARPNPAATVRESVPQAPGSFTVSSRLARRRSAKWLVLCVPEVAYSLYHRLNGSPIVVDTVVYVNGAAFFIGIAGYAVSTSLTYLRSTDRKSNPPEPRAP